jgi:hypothetical protein
MEEGFENSRVNRSSKIHLKNNGETILMELTFMPVILRRTKTNNCRLIRSRRREIAEINEDDERLIAGESVAVDREFEVKGVKFESLGNAFNRTIFDLTLSKIFFLSRTDRRIAIGIITCIFIFTKETLDCSITSVGFEKFTIETEKRLFIERT